MCIRCEAAARSSHEASVVPLDNVAIKRPMTGYLDAPKNDLQVICTSGCIACLPTEPYAALDESLAWSGEWGGCGVRTVVEKTQIGENGEANGEMPRWIRPGG
eukprot:4788658-Pyramimonas_sp.AAC.1